MTSTRHGLSRRAFLGQAATAVGSLAVPYFVPRHVLAGRPGPNDRIQVGVIGCGVRGKYLIANLPRSARVVSLCDCAQSRIAGVLRPGGEFAEPLAEFAAGDGQHCSTYQDYRLMIEREKLDAMIIAAPDHHHVLAAMLACLAGQDVYCEKPMTLTIAEGRALVDCVQHTQRILQVGSQQRTMAANRQACEFVRDGGLGKVSLVEISNYPGPMPYEPLPDQTPPKGLNWELFLGPTPFRKHHQQLWVKEEFHVGKLLWRGWDLYDSYSGHLMTNWGGHGVDMVQYALGTDETGPVEIRPELTQLAPSLADAWFDKTPGIGAVSDPEADRMRFCPVTMRYANGVELRFTPGVDRIVVHGERGKIFIWRNDYRTEPADLAPRPDPREQARWAGPGHVARPHLENWLDCLVTRQQPHAPVEVGHRTATICHLANIARQLRRPLRWNPADERFEGDEQADQLRDRPRRAGFALPQIG